MSALQITILISAFAILLLLVYGLKRWKWGIDKVANIVTIYGVAVGVALIFKLSPQVVSIEAKPKLILHSFRAGEWVYWKNRGGPNLAIPEAHVTGYISNIGTAIASNIALEFKFVAADSNFKPWSCFRAFIFPDPKSAIPPLNYLGWCGQFDATDIIIIPLNEVKGWARLKLPPVPPNSSVGIAIGFNPCLATDSQKDELRNAVTDKVSVRIVKMGDSKPIWRPDRSSIKNYQEKPITPDVTRDSCSLEFFMDHIESGNGF